METVRAALIDSVRAQSVSDVPLGIFLSGGMDSSSLVALAHLAGQDPIKTVSVTFDEAAFDESAYARVMARQYQTQHGEIRVRRQDFYEELPHIFAAMDQPTVDGVNTYFVSKAAKAVGLTVVFTGVGADEIFLGYRHLTSAAKLQRYRAMLTQSPLFLRWMFLSSLRWFERHDRMRRLQYLSENSNASWYLLFRGLFAPRQIAELLGIGEGEVASTVPTLRGANGDLLHDFVQFEFQHYLQDQLLRDTDFMTMAHSIEARVPYLDEQVVPLVCSLPAEVRLRGSGSKPLLAAALGEQLPRTISDRPKRGFTFPFGEWLKQDSGQLRIPTANSLLRSSAVQRVWHEFDGNRVHWSRPWALTVLQRRLSKTVAPRNWTQAATAIR